MDRVDGRAGGRAEPRDHGAYVTPNEHKMYFVLGAETFEAVTTFLDSPFLEDHDGHIAPVHTFGEVEDLILED